MGDQSIGHLKSLAFDIDLDDYVHKFGCSHGRLLQIWLSTSKNSLISFKNHERANSLFSRLYFFDSS